MILVQQAALATELVRDLPKPSAEAVREIWNLLEDDPELSLEKLRNLFDAQTLQAVEERWSRIKDFERALDRWREKEIYPISFDDEDYPQRWLGTFGERAPRFLFAYGNLSLLNREAVGIVGSRNATEEAREFAIAIAGEAVNLGLGVVSGAARGIDQIAMAAALESGGHSMGVATELAKSIQGNVDPEQICLVTPFSPDAAFSAGNAMSRNKLIYAQGLLTIVVQSDVGAGGTWTGALEAISKGIGRVAIWTKGGKGCEEILKRGGLPISEPHELENSLVETRHKTLFD